MTSYVIILKRFSLRRDLLAVVLVFLVVIPEGDLPLPLLLPLLAIEMEQEIAMKQETR